MTSTLIVDYVLTTDVPYLEIEIPPDAFGFEIMTDHEVIVIAELRAGRATRARPHFGDSPKRLYELLGETEHLLVSIDPLTSDSEARCLGQIRGTVTFHLLFAPPQLGPPARPSPLAIGR